MITKNLVLVLPKEHVLLLDFYTKSKGIRRMDIFRELLNSRVTEHKAEMIQLGASIAKIVENNPLFSNQNEND